MQVAHHYPPTQAAHFTFAVLGLRTQQEALQALLAQVALLGHTVHLELWTAPIAILGSSAWLQKLQVPQRASSVLMARTVLLALKTVQTGALLVATVSMICTSCLTRSVTTRPPLLVIAQAKLSLQTERLSNLSRRPTNATLMAGIVHTAIKCSAWRTGME